MSDLNLINELRAIRQLADMVSNRAAKAIERSERINAPAARKGFSAEEKARLIAKSDLRRKKPVKPNIS